MIEPKGKGRRVTRESYREIYIPVPVWDAEIVCLIGCSLEKVKEWGAKNLSEARKKPFADMMATVPANQNVRGHNFWIDGGGSIIWLAKDNASTLAHELFHATHHLLREKGIKLSDETDEVYAYLYEYLFKGVFPHKTNPHEKSI